MRLRVKIRGAYATALTRFALDEGHSIADPSPAIRERFGLDEDPGPFDILVRDREDRQGIAMTGPADEICELLLVLQDDLFDAVMVAFAPVEENDSLATASVELPGRSKERLDELRSRVAPTVKGHHRLKAIAPRAVEAAEAALAANPGARAQIEESLVREVVILPLEKAGTVRLEHIRPAGRPMRPRKGVLLSLDQTRLVFKRSFSRGRYDGLDIPIQNGDYGVTELREGDWVVKHSYFTRDGKLIGEYYNVNTPVELYPFGARYLDLEVDIIRRAGEEAFIADREKLALLAHKGCIGRELGQKAIAIAEDLADSLNRT
jgi:probable ribonuclease FAU-1